jgi:hypothetical protein
VRLSAEASYTLGLQTSELGESQLEDPEDLSAPKGKYHWLQAGLEVQIQTPPGFVVSGAMGLSYLADHPRADAREIGYYFIRFPVERGFLNMPWFRIGFGWAF